MESENTQLESAPITINPPDAAKKERFKMLGESVIREANALQVSDAGESAIAFERLKQLRLWRDSIEELFQDATDAANRAHKALTKLRGDLIRPFDDAYRVIDSKMCEFKAAERRRAQEEQERADRAAREAAEAERRKQIEAAKAEKDHEAVTILETAPVQFTRQVVPSEPPKQKGQINRIEWDFEVIDEAAVPRQFLSVDASKIRGVVRSLKGDASIPGVRIFSREKTQVRL